MKIKKKPPTNLFFDDTYCFYIYKYYQSEINFIFQPFICDGKSIKLYPYKYYCFRKKWVVGVVLVCDCSLHDRCKPRNILKRIPVFAWPHQRDFVALKHESGLIYHRICYQQDSCVSCLDARQRPFATALFQPANFFQVLHDDFVNSRQFRIIQILLC